MTDAARICRGWEELAKERGNEIIRLRKAIRKHRRESYPHSNPDKALYHVLR